MKKIIRKTIALILLACFICVISSCQTNNYPKPPVGTGPLLTTPKLETMPSQMPVIPWVETTSNLEFELNEAGDAYVVVGIEENGMLVKIPESHEGLPVNEIKASAFENSTSVLAVKIESKEIKIGDRAFYNSALNKITIESSSFTIGESAFEGCEKLQGTIPFGAKSIGKNAFKGCVSLEEASLPFTLTYMGESAFENCSSIEYLSITATLDEIPADAFARCGAKSLQLWNTKAIGAKAFMSNKNLMYVELVDTVEYIGKYAFKDDASLYLVELPTSLKQICHRAFEGCTSLEKITYMGTKAEWQSINKESGWTDKELTVVCSDGEIKTNIKGQ